MLFRRSILMACIGLNLSFANVAQETESAQETKKGNWSRMAQLYSYVKEQVQEHPYLTALLAWCIVYHEYALGNLIHQIHKPYYFVPFVGTLLFYIFPDESDIFPTNHPPSHIYHNDDTQEEDKE